jgi:hypothetical protein
MKLPSKESRLQRLVKTVNPVNLQRKSKFSLPRRVGSGNGPAGLSQDKAVKAGVITGGLAGLTAASAGISSLRRARRPKGGS